jgi:predicted transcriptional regulator
MHVKDEDNVYYAYLSRGHLKDYLDIMLENGLLEKKGTQYETTEKGIDFLKGCEHLDKMFAIEPAAESAKNL